MIHTPAPVSNKILALGGGFDRDPSGLYTPARRMVLRAEAIVRHYKAHPELFEQSTAFIAVTGRRQEAIGRVALGLDELALESEADYYLGVFKGAGIPSRLYEGLVDYDADSTPFNFSNLIDLGLDPFSLTPEGPLAIPAGPEFFERVLEYTHRLGFPPDSVVRLETGEAPGPLEPVLLDLTRTALQDVAIGDRRGVERVAEYVAARIYDVAPQSVVVMTS
jgi:hypothetical protein